MLENSVCIVCGAGHGLGEATAKMMAEKGASVVVNDLGVDLSGEEEGDQSGQETVDDIRASGNEAMTHFGDITDLDYTQQLVEDTVEEYGAVHSITNFAGILRDRMIYNMSEEEWDAVIDVHLKGHFSLLRNASRHWRQRYKEEEYDRQRSFLGVSSSAAIGYAGQPNYAAAKAGVLGLIRDTAQELHRYNVRTNSLWPDAYTRMIKSMPEEYQPDMSDETHGASLVAPLPTFLASEEAEDITGCTLGLGAGDLSFISDPAKERQIIKEVPADTPTGGWTPEQIAEAWDELTDGFETTRTSKPEIPQT
jgi:NAD(P)-dependent dehydrogenase (short-subunit alcohol dehydrogenase family)